MRSRWALPRSVVRAARPKPQTPWTFADLFREFVRNKLPAEFDDWDNLSKDAKKPASSFQACTKLCEADEGCFQYSYDGEKCGLGHSIHLGQLKKKKDKQKWKSGWLLPRINDWVEKQPGCNPEFPQIG